MPRESSLSKEEKAKIILTDLFGFECAKECLAQNTWIDEKQIEVLRKQKWLPNSVDRLGLSNIEEFISSSYIQEFKNVLASKISSSHICDKCHKKINDPNECNKCLKQFHRNCFGPDKICICCNSIIQLGIYFSPV